MLSSEEDVPEEDEDKAALFTMLTRGLGFAKASPDFFACLDFLWCFLDFLADFLFLCYLAKLSTAKVGTEPKEAPKGWTEGNTN